MAAFLHHLAISLVLNFRNRMAVIYGFLFPLLFLLGFWAIYRSDPVPLVAHMGALLTITILGGTCFGMPTALVSERERGVWRLYRLTPRPIGFFIASVLSLRYLLLILAALLQILLAMALGMPAPGGFVPLWVAFTAASLGFLGLGMMIAMLADTVPAVQALGQCIFLPMLMIGGVALPVESLPVWAQHLSAFFPGRYAVEAIAATFSGESLNVARFDLVALVLIGIGGAAGAVVMARWDLRQRLSVRHVLSGLMLSLCVWGAVGAMTEAGGRAVQAVENSQDEAINFQPPPGGPPSWQAVTAADIDGIAFDQLPPDRGVVAPIAGADETPSPAMAATLARVENGLATWPPARTEDPVQKVRNDLYVAAVPDLLRMEGVERFIPDLVLARLEKDLPAGELPRLLYWVAMHPMEGDDRAVHALPALGLPDANGQSRQIRQRVMLYAFKFLGRLTGHGPPANNPANR